MPRSMTSGTPVRDHMRRVEEIARVFHEEYERLAPQHGWETQTPSAVAWEDVPLENKSLMRAVVSALLTRGVIE